MSTRANIIVKDGFSEMIFYRHSDGYPEGAMPTLEKFMDLVRKGKIRNNVGQAAGHLIVLGREEYEKQGLLKNDFMSWKVGAIEPTTGLHGDIEHLYVLDLSRKTIEHLECGYSSNGHEIPPAFYAGKFATVEA